MGIVFSAKIASVPEQELYTRENYFTGESVAPPHSCFTLDSFSIRLIRISVWRSRFRNLLGRPHRRRVQPTMWPVGRYYRLDRSASGCCGPKPVCEDSHRGGIWEYLGSVRFDQ